MRLPAGRHGGALIDLPASLTFGLPVDYQLVWDEDARERLQAIPSFARGMVVKAVEAYARGRGDTDDHEGAARGRARRSGAPASDASS